MKNMGSILKWLALAAAAYFVWKSGLLAKFGLSIPGVTAPAIPAATEPPPGAAAAPPPAATVPAAAASGNLLADLKAAVAPDTIYAAQGNKLNLDQWNYYRNKLRPPELTGDQFAALMGSSDRAALMTAEEFMAKLQAAVGANVALGALQMAGILR